jgi:hypothetical protein
MTDKNKKIYLGKGGKHYGPFDESEIASFKKSGELENYAYIWDPFYRRWDALHAEPAPIPNAQGAVAKAQSERMEAICHDALHILNGYLEDVSGQGCVLISKAGHHRPFFAENARVKVDVLDPRSGKSATLVARMGKVRRAKAGLSYELVWERSAEVLLQF